MVSTQQTMTKDAGAQPPIVPAGLGKPDHHLGRAPLFFGIPYAALFGVFFVGALGYAAVESLRSPLTGSVGLTNYATVLHLSAFWASVGRMAYFTTIQVALMLVLAVALALLLDGKYARAKKVFGLVFFLPYCVPGVVAALMWAFILSPTTDTVLGGLGINPLQGGGVLYVIILIVTWEWTGYNITLYLAGLSAIPQSLIDAARVDGASEVKIAWHVKLPGIRRIMAFTVIASLVGTFQLFNEPAIINAIRPLPANYTPNLLIYNTAFSYGNVPLATAESLVLGVITVGTGALTLGLLGLLRRHVPSRHLASIGRVAG